MCLCIHRHVPERGMCPCVLVGLSTVCLYVFVAGLSSPALLPRLVNSASYKQQTLVWACICVLVWPLHSFCTQKRHMCLHRYCRYTCVHPLKRTHFHTYEKARRSTVSGLQDWEKAGRGQGGPRWNTHTQTSHDTCECQRLLQRKQDHSRAGV